MYKTRLEKWGFHKKVRDVDWQAMALLYQEREWAGNSSSAFSVHGRRKTLHDLKKYMKTHHLSDDEIRSNAAAADLRVPDYIRAYTPEADTRLARTLSTPALSAKSRNMHAISSAPSLGGHSPTTHLRRIVETSASCRVVASSSDVIHIVENDSRMHASEHVSTSGVPELNPRVEDDDLMEDWNASEPGFAGIALDDPWADGGLESERSPWLQADCSYENAFQRGSSDVMVGKLKLGSEGFCDQVQRDLGLLMLRGLTPESEGFRAGARDVDSWTLLSPAASDSTSWSTKCTKCEERLDKNLPSPIGFLSDRNSFLPTSLFTHDVDLVGSVAHETHMACVWMACCLGACMFSRQNSGLMVSKCLEKSNNALTEMLINRNSTVLTSALAILTVLSSHNQGEVSSRIMNSAFRTSQQVLGSSDPITLVLEWCATLAGQSLSECRVRADMLMKMKHNFDNDITVGPFHGHTLATSYCLAFSLLSDGLAAKAEDEFRNLYKLLKMELGQEHILTTMTLATISRALADQGKFGAAVLQRKRASAASDRVFGKHHPYTLESRRRLALIYELQGRKHLMEEIYWHVLEGRIKSLGATHDYTLGMRNDLISLLKDLDQWDAGGKMQEKIDKLFMSAGT